MSVILIVLGALPFVIGGILNWCMYNMPFNLPYGALSVLLLFVWGGFAFLFKGTGQSTIKIVLFLNFIAAIDVILVGVQELILHAYWMNSVGLWTQFFYLPLLNLGFTLTSWSHTMFPVYAACFILLIVASVIGCKLRERR